MECRCAGLPPPPAPPPRPPPPPAPRPAAGSPPARPAGGSRCRAARPAHCRIAGGRRICRIAGSSAPAATGRAAVVRRDQIDVDALRGRGEVGHHHHAQPLLLQVLNGRQQARGRPVGVAHARARQLALAPHLVEVHERLHAQAADVALRFRNLHLDEVRDADAIAARRASPWRWLWRRRSSDRRTIP